MNLKKGLKNIAYSIIGQAIAMILGIVIPRLVIVSYGSEVNGLLSSVSQVVTYLALLEAGVGAAALQALYKPISDNSHDGVNSILSATHLYYRRTGIIYLAITVVMSFIYPLVISSELNYWFIFGIVIICALPNVINYLFQGKLKIFINAVGDNYVVTNLSTASNVLTSVLKIALLMSGVNVIVVQAMYSAISLLQMVFIYAYIKKKYPWINTKTEPNKEALKQKKATLLHQICGLVTNSTDTLVLSIFCGLQTASIYAIYNMIFLLVYNILQSVNGSVSFIIGQSFCQDRERYKKIIDAYETYYLGICSALMCTTCVLILPFLTLYTSGADIDYIDVVLPILFSGVSLLSATRNASLNTISAAGHFKQTTKHAVIESIINLTISLILVNVLEIWGMGLYGVLIGTIVALFYRNFAAIRYSNRVILERSSKHSAKIAITNILLFAALVTAISFIKIQAESYLVWALYAIPITIVLLCVFLVVNSLVSPKTFKIAVSYIKTKVFKKGKKE